MEQGHRMPPKNKLKIMHLAQVLKIPKDAFYKAAQETRGLKKGAVEKRLTQMDPEMAVGFYRAIENVPEEKFKKALRDFLETVGKE